MRENLSCASPGLLVQAAPRAGTGAGRERFLQERDSSNIPDSTHLSPIAFLALPWPLCGETQERTQRIVLGRWNKERSPFHMKETFLGTMGGGLFSAPSMNPSPSVPSLDGRVAALHCSALWWHLNPEPKARPHSSLNRPPMSASISL